MRGKFANHIATVNALFIQSGSETLQLRCSLFCMKENIRILIFQNIIFATPRIRMQVEIWNLKTCDLHFSQLMRVHMCTVLDLSFLSRSIVIETAAMPAISVLTSMRSAGSPKRRISENLEVCITFNLYKNMS